MSSAEFISATFQGCAANLSIGGIHGAFDCVIRVLHTSWMASPVAIADEDCSRVSGFVMLSAGYVYITGDADNCEVTVQIYQQRRVVVMEVFATLAAYFCCNSTTFCLFGPRVPA